MFTKRVFPGYRYQMTLMLTLVGAATALLMFSVALLAGPAFGLLAVGLYLYWVLDRLILFGNGWLRRRLASRLRSLGEPVETGRDRFVGLSHPCFRNTFARRVLETDDDVGFLTVSGAGLRFHGDGLAFTVPAEEILDVRLERSLYAPWGRVKVALASGEPFDEIVLDSRNHSSHTACRRDNRKLLAALQAVAAAHRGRIVARLTGDEQEPALTTTA